VLLVPPGVYKTGSFNISSHTTLRLAGGIVSGITPGSMATAHWDYPLLPWQHTGGSDACVACCASLTLSVPSPPSLLSSLTTAWHGPTLIIRPCLPLSLLPHSLSPRCLAHQDSPCAITVAFPLMYHATQPLFFAVLTLPNNARIPFTHLAQRC
jgi:hypothetical protein